MIQEAIVKKYSNHPSVCRIKKHVKCSKFSFFEVQLNDVQAELKGLNPRKACKSDSIPAKLLKENFLVCGKPILIIINNNITTSTFDQDLKYADLMPVYKEDDTTSKRNYRPISLI